ncbi:MULTISPECIES: hypothetical protein [unclassified Shewanella]|uniref:hypothetical protein n=1 Tax=unclassified Shewanella TaxID=196818 RepID=UPI000C832BE0|nr:MULTISPECIES: hypothetical protein [unclassified Shewanella]MDO6618078.1 hypothetical protein [Shewanella sp. 6_MG-2023]MDO6638350.1 hypothetical protein [Shewanella sp. 5_MG-2023]MDO6677473.1 hypothetical protein [Shewanella sp. 4_MG-2023]MDO6774173.1 hypothetical protein [Shewanella sp. 3_MG-2023]PMG26486.1 hypothetical protein BCU94_06215 [Shewanella sp. 10N.286.52.C2]
MTDINLQNVINAFDELDFENRTTKSLESARNKLQMKTYLDSLDYSLRRLNILNEVVSEMVEQKKSALKKQEQVQTYKSKVIQLSREYRISYQEVLEIMISIKQK